MRNGSGGVIGKLYSLVKAFLKDFYTESKRGTLQHKKGIAVFLSFLFLCFVVIVIGLLKASETPFFCGLCHNMTVYVDSWKASKHRNVSCIKCHYKPGFANHLKGKWQDGQLSLVYFITGKSPTRPHAEIDDASCLQSGCHKRADLKNEMVFKNVLFSHPRHIEQMRRQKQLRCTTCHSQIVQGAHMTVTDVECFICHFYKTTNQTERPTGCTTCHFEARGDIAVSPNFTFNHKRYVGRGIKCEQCHTNVVSGDGHIPEFACLQCHNKRSILEAKYTPEFLHWNHVTIHKVECFTCHSPIKHQITGLHYGGQASKACSDCHSNDLHGSEVEMYLGKGARLVPERPNRMAAINMDCDVCHRQGQDSPALGSCKRCHNDLTEGMVAGWREKLKVGEDALREQIAAAKTKAGEKGSAALKQAVDDAQYNYAFLQKGDGVHNIVYAAQVIAATQTALNNAIETRKPLREKPAQEDVSCLLCHGNIEEKKVAFGSLTFPHAVHSGNEGSCLSCHTTYRDHGKTVLKGCSSCHHGKGEGKVSCRDCHAAKEAMFSGRGVKGVAQAPDAMWGKVGCAECHTAIKKGKKESADSIKAACVRCHGKDYAELVGEWMSSDKSAKSKNTASLSVFQAELSSSEKATGRHSVPLRARYDEMDDEIHFLINGGLYHNPEYSEAIAAKIAKDGAALQTMMNEQKAGKPIIPVK